MGTSLSRTSQVVQGTVSVWCSFATLAYRDGSTDQLVPVLYLWSDNHACILRVAQHTWSVGWQGTYLRYYPLVQKLTTESCSLIPLCCATLVTTWKCSTLKFILVPPPISTHHYGVIQTSFFSCTISFPVKHRLIIYVRTF